MGEWKLLGVDEMTEYPNPESNYFMPEAQAGESDLEFDARICAAYWHRGQKRKYTFEPYIHHPAEVVALVRTVPHSHEMLAAAWLHDVVEDCGVHPDYIEVFGEDVAGLVSALTDISKPSDGNRAVRKQIDLGHLAGANASAKTIKLADIISNSKSILQHDEKFAKTYLPEKRALLGVLREGDHTLWAEADRICREAGY